MKKLFVLIISIIFLFGSVVCADWDNLSTSGINEGSIGFGWDDLSTPGITKNQYGVLNPQGLTK